MNRYISFSALLLIFLATLSLSACGKKQAGEGGWGATQVIAKVNGEEVSIHQLNYQMARQGQLTDAQVKVVSKEILERLIDQELLVQKAHQSKLDRDPRVLQAIEASKREILAQAYMEQMINAAKKPTEQELKDFYGKHPELFEDRRIYQLQELAVVAGNDKLTEIESGVKAAHNLGEVSNWLKQKGYGFSINSSTRASEQLPLVLLNRLRQMKDGEFVIVPNQGAVNIIMLAGSQQQSVTLEKATPLIEQYILNQHKAEIAKQQIQGLRKEANIEYLGNFSGSKAAPQQSTVQPEKAENKSLDAKPSQNQDKSESDHIEKGVAGL